MTFLIRTNTAAVVRRVRGAEEQALQDLADAVLQAAQQAVPVDEGDLRRSGKVTVKGRTARVSFSGPYAVRQHEDLTAKHDRGSAKYLETPGNEVVRRALPRVAAKLRDIS